MSYFAPFIDASGPHFPTYNDILSMLIEEAQSIFGTDIYLGTDSQDYQSLSIFALALNDTNNAAQLAYNQRGPLTAIGTGLDSVIKINGMARKVPSYSTCVLTLTGIPNSIIENCVAYDGTNRWSLPVVAFDSVGNASTTATCQVLGAVNAAIGTITQIATPTIGWLTVTNAVAAVAGQPVELDSSVKSRQAISTALPSETLLAGTIGAIASIQGVTRSAVFENDTDSVDSNGNPAHSITCVVEGGTDQAVALAIYNNKGPGCNPNGTHSVTINDPTYGFPKVIGFYRPTYTQIYATVHLHPLTGWTASMLTNVQNALVAYLNGLQFGEEVTLSALYFAAVATMVNPLAPNFSIDLLTIGTSLGTQSAGNIAIAFNAVAQTIASQIVVSTV